MPRPATSRGRKDSDAATWSGCATHGGSPYGTSPFRQKGPTKHSPFWQKGLCHPWIDGWPGLEGGSPKPRGFLRSAQSSPGQPIHQGTTDQALEPQAKADIREGIGGIVIQAPPEANTHFEVR